VLTTLVIRILLVGHRLRHEERGDSLINWLVLAIGLATAAALVVTLLRPALQDAGQRLASLLSGT
jgi:hypothetical protein